jgi:phytol kinase
LDIAIIVTLLEANDWRGLDNIFIPIGVFVLLRLYLTMPLEQLWNRFRVAAALVLFVTAYARRTTLQGSALLASALVLYISWALGGWQWLLPPFLLLVAYSFFFPEKITPAHRTHNAQAVLAVASTGLLWLFLFRIWQQPELLFPYTVAFAAHLAIIAWSLLYPRFPSAKRIMAACVLVAWGLMFVPYILIERGTKWSLMQAGVALLISAFAFTAFYLVEPRQDGIYPATGPRWVRQAGIVLLSTLAARIL